MTTIIYFLNRVPKTRSKAMEMEAGRQDTGRQLAGQDAMQQQSTSTARVQYQVPGNTKINEWSGTLCKLR